MKSSRSGVIFQASNFTLVLASPPGNRYAGEKTVKEGEKTDWKNEYREKARMGGSRDRNKGPIIY